MKIKTKRMTYEQVLALPNKAHKNPVRPSKALAALIRLLAKGELRQVGFHYEEEGMEKLGKEEPCLILMNHSSFIDLKIAETVMKGRPLQIVCTSDGFVGKEWLMRHIGCIPTQKFVSAPSLVKDMVYCVNQLGTSILLYPEASYSFDGTATPLPESLGKCLKVLKVPVVMIETFGAFARDPLYNGLRLRKVPVSAKVTYLLSPEEIREKNVSEINEILKERFSFDYFKWQKEQGIRITEDFRAIGLERVLYKCPHCMAEGQTKGEGTTLLCQSCGKKWELTPLGEMQVLPGKAEDGSQEDQCSEEEKTAFTHIPDWYAWQRSQVKEELEKGSYHLDIPVDISILKDTKAIYQIGEGRLVHNKDGFTLTGSDGKLQYCQSPKASYSLYADYFWYELGDIICIGDAKTLYYCFPKEGSVPVAKTRLATEEMYKLC